jgi:hypothetical protein
VYRELVVEAESIVFEYGDIDMKPVGKKNDLGGMSVIAVDKTFYKDAALMEMFDLDIRIGRTDKIVNFPVSGKDGIEMAVPVQISENDILVL